MKIESLHLHPIKSCGIVSVTELKLEEQGPSYDREWMIVDEQGKFLTQRSHPSMALIEPRISENSLDIYLPTSDSEQKTLIEKIPLNQNSMNQSLSTQGVPFESDSLFDSQADQFVSVQVWSTEMRALLSGSRSLQEALSDYLKTPVRLVRFPKDFTRPAKKAGAPSGVGMRFTDRAPLLVVNQASLQDLNQHLVEKIPMSRFRPNIVLSGAPAWSEDSWTLLRTDQGVKLEITQACGRCGIINIDQSTGLQKSKEVLLKLSQLRRRGTQVDFGVAAVHRSLGCIQVGQNILLTSP